MPSVCVIMGSPMGIALGLVPPDPVEAGRVPRRLQLDDMIVDGELRHRLRRTKWDSPFTPGHDCAFDDWLPTKYVEQLKDHLATFLHERAEVGLLCTGERGGGLLEVVPFPVPHGRRHHQPGTFCGLSGMAGRRRASLGWPFGPVGWCGGMRMADRRGL